MKTKLLKLALCAMAALPIGAWADIDFGTEKTVSQKTVWNFNSLTAEQEYSTVTEHLNAYLRVTHANYKISVKAIASENITLSDNTVLSVSKVITLKKTNSTTLPPSAATTSQTSFSSSFAFNAEVPGQVIVHFKGKSEGSKNIRVWNTKSASAVSYISSNGNIQTLAATVLEKGSYFVCSNGASDDEVDIYAVEFIPTTFVGAKTLWTFNQYPKTTVLRNSSSCEFMDYDGLFIHKTSISGHNFRASDVFNPNIEAANFGGVELKSNMMPIQFQGTASNPNNQFVAGDLNTYDGMAFNASCAGTMYVAFRTPKSDSDYASRTFTIYFNGTAQTGDAAQSYTNRSIYVVKHTSTTSGTFATKWSNGAIEIVAVLFVPTNDSATDTKKVNISGAGVATFSSARSYTIAGTGLKAYKVSEVTESKATLTDIGDIIPAYTGVVLAGNEGTYTLTTTSESATVSNNSLVANVGEYALPANDGKGNYNYTLAAGPTFKHSSGSGTLAAGKAFLRTTTDVSARGLELNFDEGETTGISEIEKLRNVGNEKFFDLQGRLVAQPTRGLYIVNCKKVIIK